MAATPRMNEPVMLMTKVPKGNPSPRPPRQAISPTRSGQSCRWPRRLPRGPACSSGLRRPMTPRGAESLSIRSPPPHLTIITAVWQCSLTRSVVLPRKNRDPRVPLATQDDQVHLLVLRKAEDFFRRMAADHHRSQRDPATLRILDGRLRRSCGKTRRRSGGSHRPRPPSPRLRATRPRSGRSVRPGNVRPDRRRSPAPSRCWASRRWPRGFCETWQPHLVLYTRSFWTGFQRYGRFDIGPEPGLGDHRRHDGAADHHGHQDRVLVLGDVVDGSARTGR